MIYPGPFYLLDSKPRLHRTSPPFELTRLPALYWINTHRAGRLNMASWHRCFYFSR